MCDRVIYNDCIYISNEHNELCLLTYKMPEAAGAWEGMYDATYHRAPCPFFCMIRQDMVGDEDCLHLNIYTSELDKEARKAVMVWFHGGSFNGGFADDEMYGPDFLIEHDVILVTLNYRLGPIGKQYYSNRLQSFVYSVKVITKCK